MLYGTDGRLPAPREKENEGRRREGEREDPAPREKGQIGPARE